MRTSEQILTIQRLIDGELERADELHGPQLNSLHEAYAVIREEFYEAQTALHGCRKMLNEVWCRAIEDDPAKTPLELMEAEAMQLILESIQVAAMAKKAIRSLYPNIEESPGEEAPDA